MENITDKQLADSGYGTSGRRNTINPTNTKNIIDALDWTRTAEVPIAPTGEIVPVGSSKYNQLSPEAKGALTKSSTKERSF